MSNQGLMTPLASRLEALIDGPTCHNFHAVPWPGVLRDLPSQLRRSYDQVLVSGLAQSDSSWISGAVDSFFAPNGPLALAQEAAAAAFKADASFFVSGGTTLSNRVAMDAVCPENGRVLIDAGAHQSLFFAAEGRDVIKTPVRTEEGLPRLDVPQTAHVLAEARQTGRPFAAMALTACQYEGQRLRLEHALPLLMEASSETAIIVDEAWSAIHSFDEPRQVKSALAICKTLDHNAPVIVTQSAHKTMAAMRQASYVHLLGDAPTHTRIQQAIFRHHCTSPSWPILASLDLARAHAQYFGTAALIRAKDLHGRLIQNIQKVPHLRSLLLPPQCDHFHELDPLVLHLRSPGPVSVVQRWLFDMHRVLVGQSQDRLVIRVHVGVREDDIAALFKALMELAEPLLGEPDPHTSRSRQAKASRPVDLTPELGSVSTEYVVAYPPGVPIVQPGEEWTAAHARRLDQAQAQGAEIHCVPQTRQSGIPQFSLQKGTSSSVAKGAVS